MQGGASDRSPPVKVSLPGGVHILTVSENTDDKHRSQERKETFDMSTVSDVLISESKKTNTPVGKSMFETPVCEPCLKDGFISLGPSLFDVVLENNLKATWSAANRIVAFDPFLFNPVYNEKDVGALNVLNEGLALGPLKKEIATDPQMAALACAHPLMIGHAMINAAEQMTAIFTYRNKIKGVVENDDAGSLNIHTTVFPASDLHDFGFCASSVENRMADAPRFVNAFEYPKTHHRLGIFGNDRDYLYCTTETPPWSSLCDVKQQLALTPCYDLASTLCDQISKQLSKDNGNPFMFFTFVSYLAMFNASNADDPLAPVTEYKRVPNRDASDPKVRSGSFLLDFSEETFAKKMVENYIYVKRSDKSIGNDVDEVSVTAALEKKLKLTVYLMTLYDTSTSRRLLAECREALKNASDIYEKHTTTTPKPDHEDNCTTSEIREGLPQTPLITSDYLSNMGIRHVGSVVDAVEDAIYLGLFFGFRREVEKAYRHYKSCVETSLFSKCDWLKQLNIEPTDVNASCSNAVKSFRTPETDSKMIAFFQKIARHHVSIRASERISEDSDYLFKTYAFTIKSLYDIYATQETDRSIDKIMFEFESSQPFENKDAEYESSVTQHERIVKLIYAQINEVSQRSASDMKQDRKMFERFASMLSDIGKARATYERVYVARLADVTAAVCVLRNYSDKHNVFERCTKALSFLETFYASFYDNVKKNASEKAATEEPKDDAEHPIFASRLCSTKNLHPTLMFPGLNDMLDHIVESHPNVFDNEHAKKTWIKPPARQSENEDIDTFDPSRSTFKYDLAYTMVNHAPWLPFTTIESDKSIVNAPSSYKKIKKSKRSVSSNETLFDKKHTITPFQTNKPYYIALSCKDYRETFSTTSFPTRSLFGSSTHDDLYFSLFLHRKTMDALLRLTAFHTAAERVTDDDDDVREILSICSDVIDMCATLRNAYSNAFVMLEDAFAMSEENVVKRCITMSELYTNTLAQLWLTYETDKESDEAIERATNAATNVQSQSEPIQSISQLIKRIQTKIQAREPGDLRRIIYSVTSELCRLSFDISSFNCVFATAKMKMDETILKRANAAILTAEDISSYNEWLEKYDLIIPHFLKFVIKYQSTPYEEQVSGTLSSVSVSEFQKNAASSFDQWVSSDSKLPFVGSNGDRFFENESYMYILLNDMLGLSEVSPTNDGNVVKLDDFLNKLQLYYISTITRDGGIIPYNKIKTHYHEFMTTMDSFLIDKLNK